MESMSKSVQDVFEKTHALAHALLDSDIYQAMKSSISMKERSWRRPWPTPWRARP